MVKGQETTMRKRYFILPTLLYQVAAIEHLLRHDSSKSRAGQDIRRSLTRDERRQNSVSNKAQDMLNTLVYHWNSNNHGDFSSSDKNDMKIVERHVHSRKLRRETGNSLLCGRDLHSPTTHPLKDSDNDDEEGNTTTISTIVQELSNGTDIITTTTSTTIITTTKVVTTIYSNENGTDSSGNPIIETNSTTTVMTSSNNETTTLVAPVENSASTTSSSGVDDEVLSMEFPNSTPLSTNNIDIQGYTNDMGTMAQYNDGGRTHESSENHDKNLLWSLVLDAPIDKTNTNTVTGSNSSNSSSSTGTTELTVTELSPELNQAIQSPKKASILSGSFKIDSCTYTTAIYADVVDYSTRFTIGEVYYVIPSPRKAKTQLVSGSEKCATEPPGGQESVHCGFADDRLHPSLYQQSTVGVDGSGIACQWSSSNKKKIQQQNFSIKVGSNPSFLPDFEAHNLVVNRAGHNARTDDFEFRNDIDNGGADDELLLCHLVMDIQADSFDLEEPNTTTATMDPSRQSTVSTITMITPSTRLVYDANPRLSCIPNGSGVVDTDPEMENKNEMILYEFAFSCPTLDGVIQDVISSKQSVFGIPNGTAFGHCNIQIGSDQIRAMVRL